MARVQLGGNPPSGHLASILHFPNSSDRDRPDFKHPENWDNRSIPDVCSFLYIHLWRSPLLSTWHHEFIPGLNLRRHFHTFSHSHLASSASLPCLSSATSWDFWLLSSVDNIHDQVYFNRSNNPYSNHNRNHCCERYGESTARGLSSHLQPLIVYVISVLSNRQEEKATLTQKLQLAEERERIAADLHDLLGNTLTVIHLKSEVAERMLARDATRAEQEIKEITQLARQSLSEVRAAVTRIQSPDLEGEINASYRALSTANIAFHLTGEPKVAGKTTGYSLGLFERHHECHSTFKSKELLGGHRRGQDTGKTMVWAGCSEASLQKRRRTERITQTSIAGRRQPPYS